MKTIAQLTPTKKAQYVLLHKLGIQLQTRWVNGHSWDALEDSEGCYPVDQWLLHDLSHNHHELYLRRKPK